MIQWFKDKASNSIIVKIFLGLLAMSFGIWGVGDFMSPGMDPNIAVSVGKTDITAEEVQRRFTRELDRYRQSLGNVDSEDLKRSILNAVVEDMSQSAISDAVAQDMGLVVTDGFIREGLMKESAFKDETGAFSQLKFMQVLSENRYTERSFVKLYSADIRHQALMGPIAANVAAPKALVDALVAYRAETRTADTLLINTAALPAPAAPSEDDLKKIYDENITALTSPEYRKVSALVIRSEDLVKRDSIADEQLKAFYDENMARYRTKETRQVAQLLFETKAQAEAARAVMAPGDHLDAIAKKAKLGAPIELGSLAKDDALAKTIGAAYDLPAGEVSQPIETDLGWHLFEVKAISPERVSDFVTVKEQIRTSMLEDKAVDALYDASVALEDGTAGGTPLEELAERIGGKLIKIDAMDRQGMDPRGLEAPGLIDNERFVNTAFVTPAGTESKLIEIPKGYYVIKVEAVTPPAPKALADVRGTVTSLWDKQARLKAARALADKLAADVGPSTQLASLAKDKQISYAQVGPVTRFGQGLKADILIDTKRVSPELLTKLFSAKVGDVVTASVSDGVVIARLRDVAVPAGEGDTAQVKAQMASNIQQAIAGDILGAMTSNFHDRYPPTMNKTALDTLISTTR